MKILGYCDIATGKQFKTAKAFHNLQAKRQQALNDKAKQAIARVEGNIMERELNKLKSKYQAI